MAKRNFRLVPKMMTANTCSIYIVLMNGEVNEIARILMPSDNQMNDNLECAQAVCDALGKRIRKSV